MIKSGKNELGFTMVELLAAITILGLLMAVAIGAVSWILDLNQKRYYSTLEKNVALAAESYYADHRASLPKAVGQSRKLLLKTLVERKYLPDVLDYSKGDCTASDGSYVVVTKYSKKDYLYNVYFDCPAYKTKQEDSIKDISITIDFDYDEKKIKDSVSNIKISSTEENKIASYEYIVYKDGQIVYSSENIAAGYVDSINQQVKLKQYVPGNIRVVVTAYDMYGNRKTKEKEIAIYNNSVPECGEVDPIYKTWTTDKNAKRKITIGCVNKDIECLRKKFSETFSSDMKNGYITIIGTNNKERKCSVGVYIDKTAPVCGSDDGSKVWTNKDRKITVQCSDETSGCTKVNGYSQTFKKTTQKGKIEIKDNAGNKRDCEVDVYVDKTPPSCGTKKENKSWTNKETEVGVYCVDEDSGCKKNYYNEVINYTTKTKTITISDNAGNTTKCTVDAYVDVDKPTIPTSEIRKNNSKGEIQKNQNKWTSNTLWWGKFKSTSVSGINHYEYSEGCTGKKSGNLESGYTYNKDKNTTYCIRAINNAGTASNWSSTYYFKIDKTAPTCGTATGARAENDWTGKDFVITQNCVDSGSGCTENPSRKFTSTTRTHTFTIKDNVGHTNTCTVGVYLDKTAPTCTSSGGSSDWAESRTLIGTCSDAHSGCQGNVTKTYNTSGQWTRQSPGTVYDKVGNGKVCPANQTVKIAGPPSKPTIDLHGYRSGSWTNQDVTITASSTSPLGIKRYEYQHGDNYWKNNFNDDPTGWHLQFNNNRSSMTIKIDWESSFDYSIRAVDNEEVAGPGSDMFSVNIDKTKPNCRAPSYGTWTAADRYVEGVCSDNGGSGCIGNASKYFNTTVSVASVGTVYDNAGNSSVCEKEAVRVDKDAPYAPYFNYINPVANISKVDYSCSKNDKKSSSPNICNATIYIQNPNSHCTYEWSARNSDFGSGVSHSLFYFESNGIGADYCNWTEKCNFNSGINPSYIVLKHKAVDKVGHIGPELIINFNVVH